MFHKIKFKILAILENAKLHALGLKPLGAGEMHYSLEPLKQGTSFSRILICDMRHRRHLLYRVYSFPHQKKSGRFWIF